MIQRVLQAIPTLVGLVTLVFFVSRLLPGDPSSIYISPGIPPAVAENLRSQFGLDRPVVDQYFAWFVSALRGELGYSFAHNAPVSQILLGVFPNTIILGLSALLLECILAITIASVVVSRPGSNLDRVLSNITLIVYSLPSFSIGIVLLLVFSFGLNLLPPAQMYSLDVRDAGGFGSFTDLFRHLVLPTATLAIPGAAALARYLRTSMTRTLGEEYVLAATSMGLSPTRVFRSYVLPNSISPVLSLLGIEIGVLLTGVLVTETLFAWPGMGRIAVLAIFSRDYPMILGCTLLGGCVVVLANIVSDVLRAWIDPRIRLV